MTTLYVIAGVVAYFVIGALVGRSAARDTKDEWFGVQMAFVWPLVLPVYLLFVVMARATGRGK